MLITVNVITVNQAGFLFTTMCSANQLTGFYMRETLTYNGLITTFNNSPSNSF